jgi:opacity protein-like surface antigen
MRHRIAVAAAAAVLTVPAQAADVPGRAGELRTGAFVGGRVRFALGASTPARLKAGLTVAPTQSFAPGSGAGRAVTRFGEGVAIDFAGRNPTLSLGGVPIGAAFRLGQQGQVETKQRLGLSTGVWIGIGALVAVAAVVAVTQLTCVGRDKDFCGSD